MTSQPDYQQTTGHAITCFAVAGGNPDPTCPCQTTHPKETDMPQPTRRDRMQAIADALNDATRTVPLGIGLDGTITDHTDYSVVWDRTAEQWVVAPCDDE